MLLLFKFQVNFNAEKKLVRKNNVLDSGRKCISNFFSEIHLTVHL